MLSVAAATMALMAVVLPSTASADPIGDKWQAGSTHVSATSYCGEKWIPCWPWW
jgi:hypothetical protein